ncbi:hypothetical protein UFOVP190_404 [uncultured Caudovirales phage]|jgi:hypothetical protein|uniref:Uncharacterized protein n=1 Tax=uncultured Caudovirales phage TaxID=2100421 RepID=A0A6J7WML9_9CAUD|nr:hypothetical protein UFOVP190_404 [uncultured Caudovirales phage]
MAKIQEEVVVIKVSKLLKDSDVQAGVLTEEVLASLEAVVTELAGVGALVEIDKAQSLIN